MKRHSPCMHLHRVLETAVMQVPISIVPYSELLWEVSQSMDLAKRGFYLYICSFILRYLYFEDSRAEGVGCVSYVSRNLLVFKNSLFQTYFSLLLNETILFQRFLWPSPTKCTFFYCQRYYHGLLPSVQ